MIMVAALIVQLFLAVTSVTEYMAAQNVMERKFQLPMEVLVETLLPNVQLILITTPWIKTANGSVLNVRKITSSMAMTV